MNKPFQKDNILRQLRVSAHLDGISDLPANIRRSLSYIIKDSRVQILADKHAGQRFSNSRSRQGVFALFAGASGTGKTLAAQLLANQLSMDVCQINLAEFVNKYIGETEKNLQMFFERAEANNIILLFDEADALFGKRTEIIDSHDRYANLEVSHLLQHMENHRGIVILSSNNRDSFEPAHLRHFQYILDFHLHNKTRSPATGNINPDYS